MYSSLTQYMSRHVATPTGSLREMTSQVSILARDIFSSCVNGIWYFDADVVYGTLLDSVCAMYQLVL